MKFNVLGFGCFMLLTLSVGCGKKPEEQKHREMNKSQPSDAEVHFVALNELRRSVKENDLRTLRKIIKNNPTLNLNQHCDDGETLLTIAIKNNYPEIRDLLLLKGVDRELSTVNKETPLMVAVAHNKGDSVRILLDFNVNLNKKDAAGDTALHIAIKKMHQDLAILLINRGANLEALDRLDRNAFKLAREFEAQEVMDFIKSISQAEYGTPELASFRSIITSGDLKLLKSTLSRFPHLVLDYETINPLVLAVEHSDDTIALKGLSLLMSYQASVDGPIGAETTPLIKAVELQRIPHITMLIGSRAKVELPDRYGKTPLIHAIQKNNPKIVNMLLNQEAAPNYTVVVGDTKYSYNACKELRRVFKTLTDQKEIDKNTEIKEALGCRFWNRLF